MDVQNPNIIGLPDLCANVFSFAIQLSKSTDPGDAASLRAQIETMLHQVDGRARADGIAPEPLEHAKFALVALLDEIVMTSEWVARDDWMREPLQLKLFGTANAGEDFFTRLDQVAKGADDAKLQVLEVYATCLSLGFRGKYGTMAGLERLRGVLGDTVHAIDAGRDASRELSPHWERKESLQDRVRRWPPWIYAVAALAVVVLLVTILNMMEEGDRTGMKSALNSAMGKR